MTFTKTTNSTLVNIAYIQKYHTSRAKVDFRKNFEEISDNTDYPILNSIYFSNDKEYIGIYAYNLNNSLNMLIEFEADMPSRFIRISGDFTITKEGYQLKEIDLSTGWVD